jgi:RNA polymerase sigma-70 factor (ECF subfamily)
MADAAEIGRKLWERGRTAFPDLALGLADFTALAARHVDKADPERLNAADLFLACACLARVPGALDRFEAVHGEHLVRRTLAPDESAEEMRQAMLVKLFVPQTEGAAPKIAEYSGRGPLSAWVRIAASRAAVDQHRRESFTEPLHESFAEQASKSSWEIELAFLRGRHEVDFRVSLREALLSLTEEDRMLLRLHHCEGLTATELAPIVNASRATAHRRLQSARDALTAAVREELQARLRLGARDLDMILSLYGSSIVPALAAEIRTGLTDPPGDTG